MILVTFLMSCRIAQEQVGLFIFKILNWSFVSKSLDIHLGGLLIFSTDTEMGEGKHLISLLEGIVSVINTVILGLEYILFHIKEKYVIFSVLNFDG